MILNDKERADQVYQFFHQLDKERLEAIVRSIFMILDRDAPAPAEAEELIEQIFSSAGLPLEGMDDRENH